ncbi:acyltransferase [Sebaldella sp. S0638]|uniref:acyltransferase family protein n=1 Tax=Sebaldella sp. S0638 TaxID=2957809 RepID=UPI00209DD358|nr:acyltransferase [Sebaldella sp. S0638]MCP1226475.1 acyltransferase [Sebaldella sp. S0638]
MNKRINSFDFLKGIASIFVIMIHSGFINKFEYYYFLFDPITRIAVPCFLIISGFLYAKHINNFRYFIKYETKILLTYLIAYLIYVVFIFKVPTITFSGLFWFGLMLNFWFLVALFWDIFILYFSNFFSINKIILFVSLPLYIMSLFGKNESYYNFLNLNFPFRTIIFFTLIFVMLGFLSYQYSDILVEFKNRSIIPLIFIFSGLSMLEKYISINYFKNALGSNFLLSTLPLVFLIFIFCLKNKNINIPFINIIGKNSLFIYLFHTFFMYYCSKYTQNTFIIFPLTILFFIFLFFLIDNIKLFYKKHQKGYKLK